MNDGLYEEIATIFADIKDYNRTRAGQPNEDGHQRTRYVQRVLHAFGISDETLKALMDRGDELAAAKDRNEQTVWVTFYVRDDRFLSWISPSDGPMKGYTDEGGFFCNFAVAQVYATTNYLHETADHDVVVVSGPRAAVRELARDSMYSWLTLSNVDRVRYHVEVFSKTATVPSEEG